MQRRWPRCCGATVTTTTWSANAAPFVLTGAKLFKVEYTLAEPQSLDYAQIALVEMALVEIALVEMARQ